MLCDAAFALRVAGAFFSTTRLRFQWCAVPFGNRANNAHAATRVGATKALLRGLPNPS